MTDDSIKAKAHTMVLEVLAEWGLEPDTTTPQQLTVATTEALCRAIEQREILNAENWQLSHDLERQMTIANEHVNELEAFRREVSDAVKDACNFAKDNPDRWAEYLAIRFSFIIIPKPKPDPLVEALKSLAWDAETSANQLRAQLDAFGFEIREKGQ
jgi:hypothetical protein